MNYHLCSCFIVPVPTVWLLKGVDKFRNQIHIKVHLLQDDLPGVEPLEVGGRQQGVEEPGDHDDDDDAGARPS